ncbi:retrotransposon protein, putative, ty3-gypsy subclass [Tanacetum coccineum]
MAPVELKRLNGSVKGVNGARFYSLPSVSHEGCTGSVCQDEGRLPPFCELKEPGTFPRIAFAHVMVLFELLSSRGSLMIFVSSRKSKTEGITMDPAKVEAITKWPRPTSVTEGEKFVWNEEREKSFEELKQRLVSAPILTLPSGSGGFQIYSDASKKGLGCVLMQLERRLEAEVGVMKDYDTNIPVTRAGKANVVADALSRKSGMIAGIKVEEEIIRDLERLDIELCVRGQNGFWASLRVEPNLISQIKTAQKDDGEIWAIIQNIDQQTEFRVDDDGILWQGTKLCVPEDPTLREALMTEAHSSPFSIHPGSTKMYHDLKQTLLFLFGSGTEISMDFVYGYHGTQRKHDAIWVVVDRLTKSAHFLPIRKDYPVSKIAEMFQQEIVRLHGTPSAIVSDRDPRFTSRFGKITSWLRAFIALLFECCIGTVARKSLRNSDSSQKSYATDMQSVRVPARGYMYHPLHVVSIHSISDREVYLIRKSLVYSTVRQDADVMEEQSIPFVKILWRNQLRAGGHWETEESIRTSYPHFLP